MIVKSSQSQMYMKPVCLSWRQRELASDYHVRLHRVDYAVVACRLSEMTDRADFSDEGAAQKAIQSPGSLVATRPLSYSEYKRCSHCWTGDVIQI